MFPSLFIARLLKINLPTWLWLLITTVIVLLVGYLDWVTGIELNFFVFYFLPVSIAAWYIGFPASTYFSILAALTWFMADFFTGHELSSLFYTVWDFVVHLAAFVIIGWSISQIRFLLKTEQQMSEYLRQAISSVKLLEKILPICSKCKKIRDKKDGWQPLEDYILSHTDSLFSHGFCPECEQKFLEEEGLHACSTWRRTQPYAKGPTPS